MLSAMLAALELLWRDPRQHDHPLLRHFVALPGAVDATMGSNSMPMASPSDRRRSAFPALAALRTDPRISQKDNSTMNANHDGFDTQTSDGLLRGELIRFSEGRFLLDQQHDVTGYIYIATGLQAAWVKWTDGRPEHYLTPLGGRHPHRDTLGDLDETLWPFGLDGETKKDPWDDTRYLYLIARDKSVSDATFVTASYGGRQAIAQLANSIRNMRMMKPGAMAAISLSSETFQSKSFGPRQKPLFEIVDWLNGSGDGRLQVKAPGGPGSERAQIRAPNPRRPIDDDIPF
jgi:hypothetical protein